MYISCASAAVFNILYADSYISYIHLSNNLITMILIKMTELLMVCRDYFTWSFIDQALHWQVEVSLCLCAICYLVEIKVDMGGQCLAASCVSMGNRTVNFAEKHR